MKSYYIKYLLIFSIIVFTSCKYEIDYNADIENNKLVVTSFIQEGEKIRFTVMHSAKPGVFKGQVWDDFLTDDDYGQSNVAQAFVKDADCKLYVNNILKEECKGSNKNGYYEFSYIPVANDKIKIKIEHNDYPTLESEFTLNMSQPVIDSFDYSFRQKDDNWQLVIYLELKDKGGENFYQVKPKLFILGEEINLGYDNPDILFESHTGVYYGSYTQSDFGNDESYNDYGIFDNKQFNSQKYIIKLAYDINYGFYNGDDCNGYLEVSTIGKDAYYYISGLTKYINSFTFNINPVIIRNGFKDGYGFISPKRTVRKEFSGIIPAEF